MKISIKGVFKNLSFILVLFVFIVATAVLFTFEQNNSFIKADILNEQKQIIKALKQIDKKDVELALIQYNGKSTELQHQVTKLSDLYEYDLTGKYILNNTDEYNEDIRKLSTFIDTFNSKAYKYYKSTNKDMQKSASEFESTYASLNQHINKMLFRNIEYNKQKLQLSIKLMLGVFIFILVVSILYYVRLKKIYSDISYLQSPAKSKKDYQIKTMEADAINIRMHKKTEVKDNPSNIDPITNINNNKGLASDYGAKKNLKESNFTSVTVLEVDNFSKTNRAFNQEFSQAALKKIAQTLSLFELPTDVIARTDYNQFTVILSRETKEKAFKDMESIREAISELKFVTQTKVPVQITVSGGFFIKPNNLVLNNAIIEAKKILEFAKQDGKNRIFQKRDMEGVHI